MAFSELIAARHGRIVARCASQFADRDGAGALPKHVPEVLGEVARLLQGQASDSVSSVASGGARPALFEASLRAVGIVAERNALQVNALDQALVARGLERAIEAESAANEPDDSDRAMIAKGVQSSNAIEKLRRTLRDVHAALNSARASNDGVASSSALDLAESLTRLESLVGRYLGDGALSSNSGLGSAGAKSGAGSADAAHSERFALLGDVPSITRIRTSIDQLSRRSRSPVLILGEFGSGKRHCARVLHAATYPEGELFELDDGGFAELDRRLEALRARSSAQSAVGLTVYVHEVAQTSAAVQLRLSKLLQEQSLQLRVVASSSRGLGQACKEGLLRSELVFRFPTELELPPLRDRMTDLARLVRHFAEQSAARAESAPVQFANSALQRMQEHQWPGNLTELANFVERMFQECGSVLLEASDLPDLGDRPSGMVLHLPPTGIDFAELERELLMQALALAQNNQTRAAGLLGLTRDQIRYRLSKFEILAASGRSS